MVLDENSKIVHFIYNPQILSKEEVDEYMNDFLSYIVGWDSETMKTFMKDHPAYKYSNFSKFPQEYKLRTFNNRGTGHFTEYLKKKINENVLKIDGVKGQQIILVPGKITLENITSKFFN